MSKRNRRVPLQADTAANEFTTIPQDTLPSRRVRSLASGLIVLQLSALVLALSANLERSFLHGKLLTWLAPFHVTTGQEYIMLPLDLTRAETMDFPVVVEYQTDATGAHWHQLSFPNSEFRNSTDRSRWDNLSRILVWISQRDPSSEVLPEIAVRALIASSPFDSDVDRASAIRLVQPHVLSFDEDLIVANGRGNLIADTLANDIVYSARIIHTDDGEMVLVPELSPSLTSKPDPNQLDGADRRSEVTQ